MALPGIYQKFEFIAIADFFAGRFTLAENSPRGTGIHTFATGSTGANFSPGLVKPRGNVASGSPLGYIPDMGAFDLIADSYTASTEDAAIMVDGK